MGNSQILGDPDYDEKKHAKRMLEKVMSSENLSENRPTEEWILGILWI